MRVLIYILALLFFITSACKKKLKTKVEGSVINFALNEPLSGAEVELRELTGTVSNTGFKVVETAFSDANGNFNFDFKAHPGRSYMVIIDNEEKYMFSGLYPDMTRSVDLEKGTTNNVILTPATFGYLSGDVISENQNDSIIIITTHEIINYTSELTYHKGDSVLSNGIYSKRPEGNWIFTKKLYLNGNETTEIDTVQLLKDEYKVYDIYF